MVSFLSFVHGSYVLFFDGFAASFSFFSEVQYRWVRYIVKPLIQIPLVSSIYMILFYFLLGLCSFEGFMHSKTPLIIVG